MGTDLKYDGVKDNSPFPHFLPLRKKGEGAISLPPLSINDADKSRVGLDLSPDHHGDRSEV